jgi:carbamoyltransferase
VNILGINSVYHDSAAALLVDGRLVVAVEEERLQSHQAWQLPDVDNPHSISRALRSVSA